MSWNKNTDVQSITSSQTYRDFGANPVPYFIYQGRGGNDSDIDGAYVLCYTETPAGVLLVDTVSRHPDCDTDDIIQAVSNEGMGLAVAVQEIFDERYTQLDTLPTVVPLLPLANHFVVKNFSRPEKAYWLHASKDAANTEIQRLCERHRAAESDFSVVELTASQIGALTLSGRFQGI